jgi:hypothetical protein
MKWAERAVLACMLIGFATNLGALAAGAYLSPWLQADWITIAIAAGGVAYGRGRQLARARQRANELSDLLTRLLTEDVDAR